MASSHKHGALSGVSRDRKFDSWSFNADNRKVKIEFDVYITPGMKFRVETKDIAKDRFEPLIGTDLSKLHTLAEEAAREEFNLRQGLTWSDWLEIQIKTIEGFEVRDMVAGAKACLTYRVIPRAETPDGRVFTTAGSAHSLVEFPKPVGTVPKSETDWGSRQMSEEQKAEIEANTPPDSAHRLIKLLSVSDRRSPNVQFAYLPDTPENREGLNVIIQSIEHANQRLMDFLNPQNITATLERARAVGSSHLLAAPTSTEQEASSKPRPRKP